MKRAIHSLVYAALLGLASAGLLTASRDLTAERREANAAAGFSRHILDALGVPYDPSAPAQDLVALFNRCVTTERRGNVTFYVYRDAAPAGQAGAVRATAVPFAGRGLWGPIKGLVALEPDRRTIRRILFYEQEETPGLGGEIATRRFTQQFDGRRIVSAAGEPSIEVHAISGATMTSRRVEAMLNEAARRIVEADRSNAEPSFAR